MIHSFTPREIVSELDKHVVGQKDAKRAVAIALRNRWRRQQVEGPLRDEITPKNIILMGPTGVGKTEIARRLARLAGAPFVKVEASKFTEVGYVGRDVESMVRDLVDAAIALVRQEEEGAVRQRAEQEAEDQILDALIPVEEGGSGHGFEERPAGGIPLGASGQDLSRLPTPENDLRQTLRTQLRDGAFDEREIELELPDGPELPTMQVFGAQGMEEMMMNLQGLFSKLPGAKGETTRTRSLKVKDAKELLIKQAAAGLVDQEKIKTEALRRAENHGIIFLDEIDKIAGRDSGQGPDVSRGGVQRDLLPIIEGSSVTTKYGTVQTDHVLFIAAGAFHFAKISDLIPELQGRFPIRVSLNSLGEEDFIRILTEPVGSLVKQYSALLMTDGLQLKFESGGIEAIAKIAKQVNDQAENIGARRLHTVMERLLDDASFEASERSGQSLTIDEAYVKEALDEIVVKQDLSAYIL